MSEELQLEDVLQEVLEARLATVFTAFPGKVVNYDLARQVADVEPQVSDHTFDSEGGVVARKLPVLPGVPVKRWTGGTFFMGGPVAAGDTGLVVCSTIPIDRWVATGQVAKPNDTRRHSVQNAVFIPGLVPTPGLITELAANQNFVLGIRGGSKMTLTPAGVFSFGVAPVSAVALATLVLAQLTALKAAISAGFTAVDAGPAASGAAGAAAFNSAFTPGSVAATKVFAE